MDQQRCRLDLRFADREPQRLFLERSGGNWRSESEDVTVSVSAAPLRIELSEDDRLDLYEVVWSGDVQDLVGAFAVSDRIAYEKVTVNGEYWQWVCARDDEWLAVLTLLDSDEKSPKFIDTRLG